MVKCQQPLTVPMELGSHPNVSGASFYLQDYSHTLHCCLVARDTPDVCMERCEEEAGDANVVKLDVNGWLFRYLMTESLWNPKLRGRFIRRANRIPGPIVIVLRPPEQEYIDYEWNDINATNAYTQLELDHLTSWLSTLGGGYSALGDSIEQCADIACRISTYQFNLAVRFGGDPTLLERSKLYMAIAMIQKGRLRLAKYIVRTVYDNAQASSDVDTKLVNMCLGIWLKLQWSYTQRNLAHSK